MEGQSSVVRRSLFEREACTESSKSDVPKRVVKSCLRDGVGDSNLSLQCLPKELNQHTFIGIAETQRAASTTIGDSKDYLGDRPSFHFSSHILFWQPAKSGQWQISHVKRNVALRKKSLRVHYPIKFQPFCPPASSLLLLHSFTHFYLTTPADSPPSVPFHQSPSSSPPSPPSSSHSSYPYSRCPPRSSLHTPRRISSSHLPRAQRRHRRAAPLARGLFLRVCPRGIGCLRWRCRPCCRSWRGGWCRVCFSRL